MQFPAECRELVVQSPQGFAPFRPREHVFHAAFGHGIVQQREHGDQFRRCLDIEVVHVHAGDDTLRVVPYRFAQFFQCEENPYTVIIEVRAGFQRRGIAARRLEVAVVLFLPLVYAIELCCDTVLHQGGLRLSFDLFVYLAVNQFIALGQRRPFQRV